LEVQSASSDSLGRSGAKEKTVVQQRFKSAMKGYSQGILEHVDHISISKTPSLTEYMTARRRGVGVEPVIALVE
jgi:hypothetical protein